MAAVDAIRCAVEILEQHPLIGRIVRDEVRELVISSPTTTEVDAARTLATEAQAAARAGECERTKAIVARVNELDETTYVAVMQDRLVSYCVRP